MKTINLSLLFFGLALTFVTACDSGCNSNVIAGSVKRGDLKKDGDLTIQGSLFAASIAARNLTVQGSATVGPNASFIDGDLLVQGTLKATSITVVDNTTVQGNLTLERAQLQKTLTIFGVADISSSTIDGDVLIHGKKITLKSDVTIKGRVVFENEFGVVNIEGTGIHLLSGIVNGKAETKKSQAGDALHF